MLLKVAMVSLIAIGSLSSCRSKTVLSDEDVKFTKNDIIGVRVNWIKEKGDKYDIEMSVNNLYKKDIIIYLNDISCYKGSAQGRLKHTFFNTGERTIDFRIGEMKRFRMVCDIDAKVAGDYKIVFNRIFDNPDADGSTKGKAISEKLEWIGTLQ